MAKKWVEVAASPAYQALAPEQQEEARNQYWAEVVAPHVPPEEQASVRQAFDNDTARTVNWPGQEAAEINIVGGTPESQVQQPAPQPAAVGQSGVTREQRQQQIAAADRALDLEGRTASLNRQEDIGRGLALGGRAMLRGVVGIPDMVVTPLVGGLNRLLPEQYQQTNLGGAVDQFADAVGAPRPETAGERVSSDVTSAITGGATGIGLGNALARLAPGARTAQGAASALTPNAFAQFSPGVQSGGGNLLASIGGNLQAQPLAQLVTAATGTAAGSATREAGGGAGAQLAASLLAGLGPSALATLGAAGTRGLVRGASGEQMKRTIADFNALGATPSVGQASGKRLIQGFENMLAGWPTSTARMTRFAERQADDIGQGLQDVANSTSRNASAERAGRAIETGAKIFKNNVSAMRQALYWQADRLIPPTTSTPMTNTVNALTQMTTPVQGASASTGRLVNSWLKGMLDDINTDLQANNGVIPYEGLRKIRTEVGERMDDFTMTPDTPTRQLSGLYAALSKDMEAVASTQGAQAAAAARRANNYTRVSSDRLEQIQRVIDKNGGPEQVYNAVMQGTRDGGTTLRAVMQSLPEQGQKAVTAAVIKRMGMANPGAQDAAGDVFSAATFLTNWNKVSPEARRALFDRYGAGYSQAIDRIARVADNIKQGAKLYMNPSGSAKLGAAYSYGAALVGSILQAPFTGNFILPAATIMGGVAANGAARWLTNPRVVTALSETTKMPRGAILGQIQAMNRVAQRTGDEDMASAAAALEQAYKEGNGTDNENQP